MMVSYAAFLRGINVGGRRVRSDQLREPFVALGLTGVQTFRTSGNVIFAAERQTPAALTARIEKRLEQSLGYEVATFLRNAEEIRAIGARRPFGATRAGAAGGKLQVGLLSGAPSKRARAAVLELCTESDRLAFGERELYWLPSGGMMQTELDLKLIDRLLGPSTRRTKGTIEQLAGRHFAG
jgi:uncharacterized protein (DUF1697 family)